MTRWFIISAFAFVLSAGLRADDSKPAKPDKKPADEAGAIGVRIDPE